MIEFIKENSNWLSTVIVPIVVALIGAIAVYAKKSGGSSKRTQKIGDVSGSNNAFVNGDVNRK